MKLWLSILLLFAVPAVAQTFHPQSVEVYFSPNGGCTDAIVDPIEIVSFTAFAGAECEPINYFLVRGYSRSLIDTLSVF